MKLLVLGGIAVVLGTGLAVWAYGTVERVRSELVATGINLASGGALLGATGLIDQWAAALPAIAGGLAATVIFVTVMWLVNRRKTKTGIHVDDVAAKMGLVGYWRDYQTAFKEDTGRDFSSFVRDLVSESHGPIRIIGVDWTELFGAAISGTSEYYESILRDSRKTIRVVLHDPRSLHGINKRNAEFLFKPSGDKRYVRNHPDRIYGKILGSTQMLADYRERYPKQVDLRFTQYLPDMCAVITNEKAVCYPYMRNLKGWDSPVLVLEPVAGGMYEVVEQYFEYCWRNLHTDVSQEEERKWRVRLRRTWEDFEAALPADLASPT